jgi:hypothetical protein
MVSRSSAAVIFTHSKMGLGVRAATTELATVNASKSAPRLQITFMWQTFQQCVSKRIFASASYSITTLLLIELKVNQ